MLSDSSCELTKLGQCFAQESHLVDVNFCKCPLHSLSRMLYYFPDNIVAEQNSCSRISGNCKESTGHVDVVKKNLTIFLEGNGSW